MLKQIAIAVLIGGLVGIVALGLGMRALTPAPANVANQALAARGQGTGAQLRGGGQGQGQGVAAQGVQWTTVQGNVISVDQYAMTVQASNGEQVRIENRPWSYALEQKFSAKVGDQIKLNGFYQNGLFEIGQMQNLSNGVNAQIRDQSGRPGWAGRGNGGNGG
ncbi:MAG: hypothetical protein HY868_10280 [Chloroflexi bacterium]|nr:hypothetical protein [Chloroflexota bacterium]